MKQESDLPQSGWLVYMIENRLGQFYTGITTDFTRRFRQHKGEIAGGARALRGKSPLEVRLVIQAADRSQASKIEAAVKKLPRHQKEQLIATSILHNEQLSNVTQRYLSQPDCATNTLLNGQ